MTRPEGAVTEDRAQELFAYAVVLATGGTPDGEAVTDILERSGRDARLLTDALEHARSNAIVRVPGASAAARLIESALKALAE